MEGKITTTDIKDKETLEQVLTNLKKKRELIINIQGMHSSEFLKILKNYDIKYSRVGFKRWSFSPLTSTIEELKKSIVLFRLFCFISTIILFIFFIYWALSLYWTGLESYFISLPLASGTLSGAILIVILVIGKFILKKKPLTILKSYLGINHNGRSRRRN